MARLGVAPHVADKILNHQSGTISGVAAVYQRHEFLAERREAINQSDCTRRVSAVCKYLLSTLLWVLQSALLFILRAVVAVQVSRPLCSEFIVIANVAISVVGLA